MPELGSLGSVRGAQGNLRPYRETSITLTEKTSNNGRLAIVQALSVQNNADNAETKSAMETVA